jgi:predicted nuclease of predicted toxin-antitoxin system
MASVPPLKFFIDQCVPDSVGRMLKETGYAVELLREKLATDSPDQLVAIYSELSGAVLISLDRDFPSLAPRVGIGQQRFRRLSRIGIRCDEPMAARRIESALSLIEHEWDRAQQSSDKRMIIEVGPTYIRTIR